MKPCPLCGNLDDINWPLEIDGAIVDGGCQNCWEAQCSASWWASMPVWQELGLLTNEDEAQP